MKTQKKKTQRHQLSPKSNFWTHVLGHRSLHKQPSLAKLLAGCELIVALDGQNVLWE